MMTLSRLVAFWLWQVAVTAIATATAEDFPKKDGLPPNIVILFADNLGYEDISSFASSPGAPSTPNIDSLTRDGMKLTNWNSAASLCSASRAALLTGKYPVRTGVYPRVFKPDAVYGMLPSEVTLAEMLKDSKQYATSIVGKWHLGQRPEYLPTNQGFDSWMGIPYHMSGGSVDGHVCSYDGRERMWLPFYHNETIVQQPVNLETLAERYASSAGDFIGQNAKEDRPFFLYLAFSHVHQLCAPRDFPEQSTCQWGRDGFDTTFKDAVEEMDWISGQVLQALEENAVDDNTLVLFTSDNGPWVAEQSCSGSKGPFAGQWLRDNSDPTCTACPHDYVPDPTTDRPHQCTLPGSSGRLSLDGVPCGEDTGLGSVWEANLRMPAAVRFPGRIRAGAESNTLVSTLDVVPTILSMIGEPIPSYLDGMDVSNVLFETTADSKDSKNRTLFFWRDGFEHGPLGPPYGRFDVAATKHGRLKAWFWTKSAHYNDDIEERHDPPLLFDTLADPAESKPLDPSDHVDELKLIIRLTKEHKGSIDWTLPLALATNPKYLPCSNAFQDCRTDMNDSGREV